MRYYVCGLNTENPAAGAKELADHGFHMAVTSNAAAVRALRETGLEAYACVSAFGRYEGSKSTIDCLGEPRVWFGSGCPNDEELTARRLDDIRRIAAIEGLNGVLVDGARFASPASQEGIESLFTCFCPHCMEKGTAMGYDMETMRAQVEDFRMRGGQLPQDWLRFRADCITGYMRQFAQTVREVNASLQAAAFVFAPSLSWLVGQTERAYDCLDMLAPMLYRRYPHEYGPACLNHEHAALMGVVPDAHVYTGAPTEGRTQQDVREDGFSPEWVGQEVRRARGFVKTLAPILQIEDAAVEETIRAAEKAGADACGFYAYGQAELPYVGDKAR